MADTVKLEHPITDTLSYYKHQFISVDRTLELYFTGCSRNCPGCQNPELQKVLPGTVYYTPSGIIDTLLDYVTIANQVHILGGEPLEQPRKPLTELCRLLKEYNFKNIVLFTGYDIPEEKLVKNNGILRYVDYIKVGPYDENNLNIEKKPEPLLGLVLASNNQKLYKL